MAKLAAQKERGIEKRPTVTTTRGAWARRTLCVCVPGIWSKKEKFVRRGGGLESAKVDDVPPPKTHTACSARASAILQSRGNERTTICQEQESGTCGAGRRLHNNRAARTPLFVELVVPAPGAMPHPPVRPSVPHFFVAAQQATERGDVCVAHAQKANRVATHNKHCHDERSGERVTRVERSGYPVRGSGASGVCLLLEERALCVGDVVASTCLSDELFFFFCLPPALFADRSESRTVVQAYAGLREF
jgi:hypothetical protein